MEMVTLTCGNPECGATFERGAKDVRRARRNLQSVFYCSKTCSQVVASASGSLWRIPKRDILPTARFMES